MRTIKLRLFVVLAIMFYGVNAAFGQAIYYDANEGGVVIDCTMMPEGTVLTSSMQDSNDDYQLPSHNEVSDANKVYPMLVVAAYDLSANVMQWTVAESSAKSSTATGKDDWRLPNQRELMLIYVLRNEIESAFESNDIEFDSFDLTDESYWSSTICSTDTGTKYWYTTFKDGYTNYSVVTEENYARAVREIALQ